MTQFYIPPPMDGGILFYLVRWAVGSFMVAVLILGFIAVRRREIANDQAWMTRAYGLGLGAGTQALTHLPWTLVVGMPESTGTRTFLLTAGWVIYIVLLERILARRTRWAKPKRGAAGAQVAL